MECFHPGHHSDTGTRLTLRMLETTDLHGNLVAYDYYTNRAVSDYGLTRTATLIREARDETVNSLLFDNGDFLQGTPLSDITAIKAEADVHPAIMAMNALKYDAVALGNHEFNYGLDWLERTVRPARFPIVCANLTSTTATSPAASFFKPYVVLERCVQDDEGKPHSLRIGVIGLLPPQTTKWDQFHLKDKLESRDILDTAKQYIPEMRAAGADVIIALCHSGIDPGPARPMMENAALQLGDIPGIDAILAGHTHEVFPNRAFGSCQGAAPAVGTLNGTPAVMAGSRGAYLGVLDLHLTQCSNKGWEVTGFRSEARPLTAQICEDEKLSKILEPAHISTIHLTSKALGESDCPLHSYLDLVGPSAAGKIVTLAKIDFARSVLRGTRYAHLPVLASRAPFKTGGRAGPDFFTDVPVGVLYLRHAADLYSFPNTVCLLHLTGAEIRDRLERASVLFNQITPAAPNQFLCNPKAPGHHFEMVDGLSYQINLTSPARYDVNGNVRNPSARRIVDLRHHGQPLDDDQRFILATNNYRAFGGGPFQAALPEQIIHVGTRLVRDLLTEHIKKCRLIRQSDLVLDPHWRFQPIADTYVLHDTGPGLRNDPSALAGLGANDLGNTDAGFMRLAIPL